MTSDSTHRILCNSSVAHQCREYLTKRILPFGIVPPGSASRHRHFAAGSSRWKSCAMGWIGKFHLWIRSVPRACLPFICWRTSTSTRTLVRHQTGKTESRADNGWSYFAHLSLSRIFIYPRSLRLLLRLPSKSSLKAERRMCCPSCRIFS